MLKVLSRTNKKIWQTFSFAPPNAAKPQSPELPTANHVDKAILKQQSAKSNNMQKIIVNPKSKRQHHHFTLTFFTLFHSQGHKKSL